MTLDLRPATEKLSDIHERFVDETLDDTLSYTAFTRFDATAYSAEEITLGQGAWALRALDEYRSMVAFGDLYSILLRIGVASDVLGACLRVVRDEDRHVQLCGRLIVAMGGDWEIPGDPNYVAPPAQYSPLHQALHTLVGSLCLGETFSMMVLAEMQKHTVDPLASAVVGCLARDEAVHSLFGWQALGAFRPHLTEDDVTLVRSWLSPTLDACQKAMRPRGDGRTGPLHPFGSIDDEVRVRVTEKAMTRIARELDRLDLSL